MRRYAVFSAILLGLATNVAAADVQPKLTAGVRVQALYQNDETCGQPSTFALKRVRLGVAAALDDRLSAIGAIEGRDRDDGIIVMEAYGRYDLNRNLRLQAGQMYVPFGLESRRGFSKREFYDRTYVTDQITRDMGRRPIGQRDARFRDIGIEVIAATAYDGYEFRADVMVMNGNGILTTDNNNAKDVVGRATVTAPFGLTAGGSFYHGTYVATEHTDGMSEQAFGGELSWVGQIAGRETRVEGEYLIGKWDTDSSAIEPRGAYLAVSAYVAAKLETAARFDWFEPDRKAGPVVDWKRLSLALRYYLVRGNFVAAEYEFRDKDNDHLANRLTLQLLTVF